MGLKNYVLYRHREFKDRIFITNGSSLYTGRLEDKEVHFQGIVTKITRKGFYYSDHFFNVSYTTLSEWEVCDVKINLPASMVKKE